MLVILKMLINMLINKRMNNTLEIEYNFCMQYYIVFL